MRTLSFSSVKDFPAGERVELAGAWPLDPENEVEQHYASIGDAARVRLKDGRVVEAQTAPVLQEAQRFSKKFEPKDLEPVAVKKT